MRYAQHNPAEPVSESFAPARLEADGLKGQNRGIALNSAATTITASYIADIKAVGQDTQAIAGWSGSGPYTIENNFIEAAADWRIAVIRTRCALLS